MTTMTSLPPFANEPVLAAVLSTMSDIATAHAASTPTMAVSQAATPSCGFSPRRVSLANSGGAK